MNGRFFFATRSLCVGSLFLASCTAPVPVDPEAKEKSSSTQEVSSTGSPSSEEGEPTSTQEQEPEPQPKEKSEKESPEGSSSGSGEGTTSTESTKSAPDDEDSSSGPSEDETGSEEKKGKLHEFMRKLNGPRPCAKDAPKWEEVESYEGQFAGFPKHVVEKSETSILTGRCSGTLIGADLAITAAQCDPKSGDKGFRLRVQLDASGKERKTIETEVIEVIERNYSLADGFEYAIVRLSEKVGERWGWTKLAAIELSKNEPLGLVHAPLAKSEKFGAGTFLQAGQGGFLMSQSLHSDKNSVGAGVLDRSGFMVGVHAAGKCCESGIQGCDQGKEIAWHSSIFAAWKNSSRLKEIVSVWEVGGPGKQFTGTGSGQLYGLAPNGSSVWRLDKAREWTQIGGVATEIFGGKTLLFARTDTELFRYHPDSNWSPIGGTINAKDRIVVEQDGDDVFRLPEDRSQVQRLVDGEWLKIGGPAAELFPAPEGVFAVHPEGSSILLWNAAAERWTQVCGKSDQIVQGADGVFFHRDKDGVFMKGDAGWEKIGGPAEQLLVAGKGELFAIHSQGQRVWRFDPKSKAWSLFGRPSTGMVRVKDRFFAVDKTNAHILEYRMP